MIRLNYYQIQLQIQYHYDKIKKNTITMWTMAKGKAE